jgi:hypothetical protein
MIRYDLTASRRLRRLLALSAAVGSALALAACSTFGHLGGHHEGGGENNAYPANYRSDLIAFMQTYLNDPTNVREAQIAEPVLMPVNSTDRYVACIKYNAKNSAGRYVGVKQSMAVYLRGRFNQLVDATGDSCKTAAYQPFPELESLKR